MNDEIEILAEPTSFFLLQFMFISNSAGFADSMYILRLVSLPFDHFMPLTLSIFLPRPSNRILIEKIFFGCLRLNLFLGINL